MALTRTQIVDTAMGILRDYGLADLSMRRLARDLGVQPGALYWHVKNKQELFTVLAGLILAPADSAPTDSAPTDSAPTADLRLLSLRIRSALLEVRDGAEVVGLAHALTPDTPSPLLHFTTLLAERGLPPTHAVWAGRALVHYILGFTTQEQTRAGLIRAGLLTEDETDCYADQAFCYGLDLFLAGLPSPDGGSVEY
ncbi:TetR family transcriptional regulator [Arthrobacter cryoconiti]|uniref:TetR family transcriptional regulator n=1 Tax=Arthrobacter cryoconiti TaxID=748907 RepID=A0ABV8QY19_9MICC|nr:TetR family transcriptional regulator [Arthrobacter cryoconiti]MCC9068237.1 TetR family transcriptional regulator [Arthrobacter cryoconiti]